MEQAPQTATELPLRRLLNEDPEEFVRMAECISKRARSPQTSELWRFIAQTARTTAK